MGYEIPDCCFQCVFYIFLAYATFMVIETCKRALENYSYQRLEIEIEVNIRS